MQCHRSLWDRSQPLYAATPSPSVALHESLKPFWASVSPFERTAVARVCPTGLAGLCSAAPRPLGPPPRHWCPGHCCCCCSRGRCGTCHAQPASGAPRSPRDAYQLPGTTAPRAGQRHRSSPRPGDSGVRTSQMIQPHLGAQIRQRPALLQILDRPRNPQQDSVLMTATQRQIFF